nr:MAG TPA: hypothetical protein [Caudoviricetes sp.]
MELDHSSVPGIFISITQYQLPVIHNGHLSM